MSDFHSSLCVHGQVYIFLMRSLDTASFILCLRDKSLKKLRCLRIFADWQMGNPLSWTDWLFMGWLGSPWLVRTLVSHLAWPRFIMLAAVLPGVDVTFFIFKLSQHLSTKCLPFYPSSLRVDIQLSCSVASNSLWPHGLQHTRLPCLSPTPTAGSNSCPSSQWCHPAISASVIPFSSCLQYLCTKNVSLISLISESRYHPSIYPGGISEAPPMCQAQFQTLREKGEQYRENPHLGKLVF